MIDLARNVQHFTVYVRQFSKKIIVSTCSLPYSFFNYPTSRIKNNTWEKKSVDNSYTCGAIALTFCHTYFSKHVLDKKN